MKKDLNSNIKAEAFILNGNKRHLRSPSWFLQTDLLSAPCGLSFLLVVCIFTALVEEPTKLIKVDSRAHSDAAVSMQKQFLASSVRTEAGGYSSTSRSAVGHYSFESMSATNISAVTAESLVSTSSSSRMTEMSALSHVQSLTTGAKRGEMFNNTRVRKAVKSKHCGKTRGFFLQPTCNLLAVCIDVNKAAKQAPNV